jgi:serine/threonine protein kinase
MPDGARVSASLAEAIGDKYEVLNWIGGGGMAQVFLARHRVTGGLFAVKVLAEHLCHDPTVVQRFIQEARTAATLSGHPNVVSIFDVGQRGDLHYLIMQYVEGEDLKTRLSRQGKLPPAEAARIIEQVAEALVFASSRRIVHRDLKPSNIRMDPNGRAVVLDFGIAKAGEMPTVMTAAGERLGTPYYMSPEHFRDGVCDHRSDLYSLGVVFFELLTGARPFEGDSVRAIESAHLAAPPPSPGDLDPGIPPAYSRVVLRLLQKRPEDRYQTASALLEDLRGEAASAPVEIPASAVEETPLPAPSRSAWPGIAAIIALIVLVAGAVYLWRGHTAASLPQSLDTSTGTMVLVPEGGFYVDSAAVSNSTYKSFCDATGYPYPQPPPSAPDYFYARPDQPVLNVGDDGARAFAAWAGKRLPTDAEWKAAVAALKLEGAVAGFRCVKDPP